ncbi:MAG: histidinol-phosphatase [Clostridia bacterium]|nr:histidinol-phosphatase [Clostridia bacterium]
MYANYHTHTYRCSHATGTEEEYIKRAIDGGIKIMGFSDHAPVNCVEGYKGWWRVQPEDAKEYIDTINSLKEKYKDKIKIHVGFEMEYYPEYFEEMLKYVKELGAEYIIMGEHYIDGDWKETSHHSNHPGRTAEELKKYVDTVIEGMKTGEYLYVAHPDMVFFDKGDEVYKREAKRICTAAKEMDIPLELNLLGIYDNRNYPDERFLKVAGEVGCKMILGFDAHDPYRAFDDKSLVKAEELINKYNLNIISDLEDRV